MCWWVQAYHRVDDGDRKPIYLRLITPFGAREPNFDWLFRTGWLSLVQLCSCHAPRSRCSPRMAVRSAKCAVSMRTRRGLWLRSQLRSRLRVQPHHYRWSRSLGTRQSSSARELRVACARLKNYSRTRRSTTPPLRCREFVLSSRCRVAAVLVGPDAIMTTNRFGAVRGATRVHVK